MGWISGRARGMNGHARDVRTRPKGSKNSPGGRPAAPGGGGRRGAAAGSVRPYVRASSAPRISWAAAAGGGADPSSFPILRLSSGITFADKHDGFGLTKETRHVLWDRKEASARPTEYPSCLSKQIYTRTGQSRGTGPGSGCSDQADESRKSSGWKDFSDGFLAIEGKLTDSCDFKF